MENRIGFGPRLGALLLDVVIVCVVAFFGGGMIGGLLGGLGGAAGGAAMAGGTEEAAAMAAMGGAFGAIFGMILAAIVIAAIYFLIEGFTGFTLGKLILGIRVASADGTAAPVSRLLGRYALKNISSLLGLLALFTGVQALRTLGNVGGLIIFIGCFFALGMSRQALHDRIIGTAVYPKGAVRPA